MGTPPPPPFKIKISKIRLCHALSWSKIDLEPKFQEAVTFGAFGKCAQSLSNMCTDKHTHKIHVLYVQTSTTPSCSGPLLTQKIKGHLYINLYSKLCLRYFPIFQRTHNDLRHPVSLLFLRKRMEWLQNTTFLLSVNTDSSY